MASVTHIKCIFAMNKISAKLKLIIFKYSELVFILTFWHSKQPHKEITYNNSRL